MRKVRAAVVMTLLVCLAGRAPPCFAQSAPAAQILFDEGRAAMTRGDFAVACAKLADSQKLAPAPGTLFNLALCYEKAGRTASAWVTYRDAAAAYERVSRPEWASRARDKFRELEASLARLTVTLDEPAAAGTTVTRDGNEVVASERGVAMPVDPGEHLIEAVAPGHQPFTRRVTLTNGASIEVAIPLLSPLPDASSVPMPVLVPLPVPAAAADASSAAVTSPAPNKYVGLAAVGAGVVGLGISGTLGLLALGAHNESRRDCPANGACSSRAGVDANESARSLATAATVAFVVGGAFVAAGITLVVTAPKSSVRAAVQIAPHHVTAVARW